MKYNPAFDGIRAVAVLAVVAFHCRVPWLLGGFIGVDIFFVLSGFLITTLLREELAATGTIALGRFYLRRVLRLVPAFLLMLIAYFVVAPHFLPVDPLIDVLLAGLYLSDYSLAFWYVPEYLSHTWSLAVEEHFYLIWPVLVLAAASLAPVSFVRLLWLAFAAVTLWRWLDLTVWLDWTWTYYRFDTRASGLILGCIIAISPPRFGQVSQTVGFACVAVLAALMVSLRFLTPWPLLYGGLLTEIAAAGLILAAAEGTGAVHRFLSWRPLAGIGLISYSIYLWHFPIVRILRPTMDPWSQFAITASLTVTIAILSYILVERPIRNWGNARLQRSRADRLAQAGP